MGVYQRSDNWYIDYYLKGRRKRKKIGPSKKLAQQVLKDVQVKMIKKEYLGVYEEKKITFSGQVIGITTPTKDYKRRKKR